MSFDNANSLLTLNKEPFPTHNITSIPPIKSNTAQDAKQASKLLLKSALQKANIAVQCDSTNDVLSALNAYKEAITLLERVLSTVEKENDKQRLQSIHDSYSERIRLLTNITSKLDSESIKNTTIDVPNKVPGNNNDHKLAAISNNSTIRKMASKSSIRTNFRSPINLNYWQDNWLVSQKETSKYPISPPIFNMQASKSTPTHSPQRKQKNQYQPKLQPTAGLDLGDQSSNHRNSDEILLRPHKYLLRKHDTNSTTASNRSSVCSVNSMISSVDSMVEQPSMVLPSLNNKNEEPTPKMKAAFRLSSSSLHSIHRSSSMSNVEAIISHDEQQLDSDSCTPPQIYPPQMIINRPVTSRPAMGGLGSMRRKAVHRLSMDSFIMGRNKDKLALSPSVGSDVYDFFLKNQTTGTSNEKQQDELNPEEEFSKKDSSTVKHSYLKLLIALEKSMLEGAHITPKLYIPKNLWQQPNIRLASMDIKIAACETLIREMNKLENWYLEDLKGSLKVLNQLEVTVNYVQLNLSKKLKNTSGLDSNNGNNGELPYSPVESNKKTSTFISFGAKLTKSVNAFSLVKNEDQYKNYIETLQRFFERVHILEQWLEYFHSATETSRKPQHDLLISKLASISVVVNDSIGGFVIRDVTLLLSKWLKRGGSWVYE